METKNTAHGIKTCEQIKVFQYTNLSVAKIRLLLQQESMDEFNYNLGLDKEVKNLHLSDI